MKNIIKNCLKGGALGLMVIGGLAACSDDHFDVKTDLAGSRTIWQNIAENEQLQDFAAVLKRTRVMKNDYDNKSVQTYAEFLNLPQSYTVWAPKDGTYDVQTYLSMLDEAEALKATGNPEDLDAALDLEYRVGNQFVLNHVARFNYESNKGEQTINMLNGKKFEYNAGLGEFNSVQVDNATGNINASNGSMHLLEGISPYAYNLYDFLKYNEDYSMSYAFLSDSVFESTEFYPGASTPGAMNPATGEIEYVDSAFLTTNTLRSRFFASVADEDSMYVAIFFKNSAWEDAVSKLKKYYNYGSSYNYDWSSTRGDFNFKGASGLKFNTDSLADLNTKSALMKDVYFTTSNFSIADSKDSTQIIEYATKADSLNSTTYMTWYNPNPGQVNPLFAGITPTKASNGYIFELDALNADPADFWISKIVTMGNAAYVKGATSTTGEYVYLTDEIRNDTVLGIEDLDYYYRYEVSGNSNMTVDIALHNVMSGTYKISAIMVPSRTDLAFAGVEEKCVFYAEVLDDNGKVLQKSDDVEISQDEMNRYTLFEEFTFDKCYAGLPTGYTSFPRLRFNLPFLYQMKKGNCKTLNIVKIVLEPCREN